MSMQLPPGTRFFLLRHGRTDYNRRLVRCGGDIDIPLDAVGRRQAEIAGCLLRDAREPINSIVSSCLQRTAETARIVSAHLGQAPIHHDVRLDERHLGEWNGLPIAATSAWLAEKRTPPGGESEAVFSARVLSWLNEHLVTVNRPGLVVASKGVGRVLMEALSGEAGVAMPNGSLLLLEGSASGNRISPFPGAPST